MAYLLDQKEPVLVMPGYIVTIEASDGTVTTKLRFSDEDAVDVPTAFSNFFVFMKIPRLESEALRWLKENSEEKSALKELLRKGWLISVPPMTSYSKYLAEFEGIRVVPACYIQREAQNFDDFHYATIPEHAHKMMRVTTLLGASMWDSLDGEDLPTSVNRLAVPESHKLAPPTAYSEDQKAKMTLMSLNELLDNNYIRLERSERWLEAPERVRTGWLAKLLGKN